MLRETSAKGTTFPRHFIVLYSSLAFALLNKQVKYRTCKYSKKNDIFFPFEEIKGRTINGASNLSN